jgi:pyoverdine/dityrosine biosynthesis protein Dit1
MLEDLLSVPDKDVWNYGEALRALAAAKGLEHIAFARLGDLVTINLPSELDEMTYVANASNFRRALLNTFSRPDWSWDEVRQGEDACLTYRGYIKFLQTDLETVYPIGENRTKSKYKRGLEYIAKQMMARGDVSDLPPTWGLNDSVLTIGRHPGLCQRRAKQVPRPRPAVHPPVDRRSQAVCQSAAH